MPPLLAVRVKGASHFCAAGGRKSKNDECAAVEIMRANSELIISGTANGRGDRRESKHRVKLNLVGAVEGLYIGTIAKKQESLYLTHRFACR